MRRPLARYASLTATALVALVALSVFARRASGELTVSLDPWALMLVAATMTGWTAGARLLWREGSNTADGPNRELLLRGSLTASVVLLLIAVSLSGTSAPALATAWTIGIAGEAFGWWTRKRGQASIHREKRSLTPFSSEEIAQEIVRSRLADGSEVVRGVVSVVFSQGQRTAAAHVAFCPPLPGVPNMVARQIAGPEARIKEGQVLAYGARFDLKLAAPCEWPAAVRLEFTASSPPPTGR